MKYRDLLLISKKYPNCCESWKNESWNEPEEGTQTYRDDAALEKAHYELIKRRIKKGPPG